MNFDNEVSDFLSGNKNEKTKLIADLNNLKALLERKMSMQDKLKNSIADLNKKIEELESKIKNLNGYSLSTLLEKYKIDYETAVKLVIGFAKDKEKGEENASSSEPTDESSPEPTNENSSEGVHEETEEERAKRERKERLGLPV